ncbi:E3 ubiquitin-protein ligase TRIM71-like [Mercenaria mercenaria]|uniref:E3 ubiquitin-protein ligase TRIM71-like n=1 Tax=Mercenaria mercenaria TaxID=6596 RepID=UPI00234EA538|nr:E3 ubiquitin-protein ligase TRIM71-like [Mercenaria mercenaria]
MAEYSKVLKVYCDLCMSTFGRRKPADGYCVNCSNNLCDDCCKYHKTIIATKDHVVIQERFSAQYEIPVVKVQLNKESRTVNDHCPLHQENIIEYHCGICDHFICRRCKSENHNRCAKVELLVDTTDDSKVETVIETLQNIMTELERHKTKLIENEQKVKDLKERTNTVVEEQIVKLFQLIDQMKSDFKKRIEKIEKDSKSKLSSVSRLHGTLTSEIESLLSHVRDAKELGKRCEMFKVLRKVDMDLPSLQSGLGMLARDNDIERDYCKSSTHIDQLVNQMKTLLHTVQGACVRKQHN